jgi:hypothetical protein
MPEQRCRVSNVGHSLQGRIPSYHVSTFRIEATEVKEPARRLFGFNVASGAVRDNRIERNIGMKPVKRFGDDTREGEIVARNYVLQLHGSATSKLYRAYRPDRCTTGVGSTGAWG